MQHSQRGRARRQDGHGDLAQDERIALDDRGIAKAGNARTERGRAGTHQDGHSSETMRAARRPGEEPGNRDLSISHAGSLLPVAGWQRICCATMPTEAALRAAVHLAAPAVAAPVAEW